MRASPIAFAVIMSAVSIGSAQQPDLRSRAEITNYEETSSYADVQRVIDGLVATSPLVHTESFGKTEEGRDLPLLVISEPKVTTPDAARKLGRPLVFVQANIHAGEVEGKEAVIALARRLTSGDLKPLTKQLVILIAPNYNADGNEKVNVQNRTAQYGPVAGVGTRENGKGLDLNRDYMKLDSQEARALVGLMNKWDPHVLVDLHTTNGSYHANHLTYSPILNPNADARLIEFTREKMLAPIRDAMLKNHKWRTYYYGNFAPEDGGGRESSRVDPANPGNVTWRTFDHRPRFGNNYAGLRNRIAILSEAYSYLDFKGRVDVTEDFVDEIFKSSAANAKQIMTLTAQADRQFTAPANAKPVELGVEFEIRALPEKVGIFVGDVKKVPNPRSGKEMLAMTDMAVPVSMKDYGVFAATRSAAMPKGWLIPDEPAPGGGRGAPAPARRDRAGDQRSGAGLGRAVHHCRLHARRARVPGTPRGPAEGRVREGATDGRARGAVRAGRPTAGAAGVLPARARKRRWPRHVECHRRGAGGGPGVSDLSRH